MRDEIKFAKLLMRHIRSNQASTSTSINESRVRMQILLRCGSQLVSYDGHL